MGNGHVRLLLIDRTKQKQNDADEEMEQREIL